MRIINFPIDKSLLKRLEDFRFKMRFSSRAEAIRYLLDWALKKSPKPPKN